MNPVTTEVLRLNMKYQKCYIYLSSKKQDHYIYLHQQDDFSAIPSTIQNLLGKLTQVMELELDDFVNGKRKLAQADIELVIEAFEKQGFYLQTPKI